MQNAQLRPVGEFKKKKGLNNSVDSQGHETGIYAFNYNLAVILKRE